MTSPEFDLIGYYQRHLRGLSDPEMYDTEALLVLTVRDDLQDQWDRLTERQKQRVLTLDRKLLRAHQQVASVLPSRQAHDPYRWWWFLHEGPKVQEAVSSSLPSPRRS